MDSLEGQVKLDSTGCRKVENFMSHWGQRHRLFLPANFLFFWYSYGASFLLANLTNCETKVADLGGAIPVLASTHVPFEQMLLYRPL